MKRRANARAMTLLEVMVSVAILAMVSVLIYGAFDGMARSKKSVGRINDRFAEGRSALRRINDELSSAFLSAHQPLSPSLMTRVTCFVGTNGSPADRVDFTAFAHRRVVANAHESDQAELSYFGSEDPHVSGKNDLVRREQAMIDLDCRKGGSVNVLAEDIDLFDLKYLDPVSSMWQETWDTSQATGQLGRLPLQVKVTLVLRNGVGGQTIPLVERVALSMPTPLSFAVPR